jgi:GT2 family glycosyltransferase
MFETSATDMVAASRTALLDEIGTGHDLSLVRGPGNMGDELILAGARALLGGLVYREIEVDRLAASTGDTALLCIGGAWCRPYHEWAPRALALAGLRFRRVIVLPASFDVGEDTVRAALERTSATVFAREHESLRHIQGLCRARLAHDCAFFLDYSAYRLPGSGTLNAFRTDPESLPGALTITGNDDLSNTSGSLDSFLRTIASHELVRTDRAHVMIAAALLGKQVEFASSSYFKVGAIAESWLGEFPVTQIPSPRAARPARRPRPASTAPAPARPAARVTVVVLTRDRREEAATAVGSALGAAVPVRVLVIANNPDLASRDALTEVAGGDPRIELRILDRNLGCAGGRRLASELVETELVLFLDDDAELTEGALERLIEELDAHPEAIGVTALVVGTDGTVQHCGGWIERSDDTVRFTHGGGGLEADDPAVPETGPSGWLPGTAALVRAGALAELPLDAGPSAYYEDNEWSFRVRNELPSPFRRCREARVLHHGPDGAAATCELARISWIADRLEAQARFLDRHGLLLDIDLTRLVPELALDDGSPDVPAARLLLELVIARGTDWLVAEWMGAGLEPLLGRGAQIARLQDELAEAATDRERLVARADAVEQELDQLHRTSDFLLARHRTLQTVESGGWWRLRQRLQPLIRGAALARRLLDATRRR